VYEKEDQSTTQDNLDPEHHAIFSLNHPFHHDASDPPHTKHDCLIATYDPEHTVPFIGMNIVHFLSAHEADEFVQHLDKLCLRCAACLRALPVGLV
jgi:hypothetical protein